MKIERKKIEKGIEILKVSGRIDPSTSNQLEAEIDSALNAEASLLVLNLSEVDFISSTGLRIFLSALKKAKSKNGDVKICCMNSNVEKIFKIAGFVSLFDIFPTEEEAVQKFL